MQINRKEQADGKTRLELSASRPDEPHLPVRGLLVDAAPDRLSGDRLSVAAALAFQRYVRGMVTFPQPVSARLANALAEFRAPVWLSVSPVEDRGTQFGGTGTTLVLDVDGRGWRGCNSVETGQVTVLGVLRSDRWTGRLFSMDQLLVASNAWMFDDEEDSVRGLSSVLAVAVMMAGDLEASRVLVPHARAADPVWEDRVVRLLAAVGIDLLLCTPADVADLVVEREWFAREW